MGKGLDFLSPDYRIRSEKISSLLVLSYQSCYVAWTLEGKIEGRTSLFIDDQHWENTVAKLFEAKKSFSESIPLFVYYSAYRELSESPVPHPKLDKLN